MEIDNAINSLNKRLFTYLSKQKKIEYFVTHHKLPKKISGRWIAGETLPEALEVAKNLNLEGRLATIDHVGEDVTTPEKAIAFAQDYHNILAGIFFENLNSNVSLKPTQIGLGVDEELCYNNFSGILEVVDSFNNFVRIDMEGSDYTQKTIDMYKRLRKKHDNVGIVMQSCLYRTEEDIDDLLKLDTNFRLCKGAYKEPADIAFPNKKDVDKNFIKISEKLLLSGTYQAFATHDEKMIEHIKSFAKAKGISRDMFEFQMLYGVRRELQQKLVDEGYKVRTYVPYGEEWYPYTMRRFAESWHNLWFVLKDVLKIK